MTLWDVLAASKRRWYVVVLGLICTAISLFAIHSQPTVYFSRAYVFFLAPASTVYPNVLGTTSLDLIAAAGTVGIRVNEGEPRPTKTASAEVTIVGRGILDGTSVMLPDHGGQWSIYYDTQALEVQVVAPTPGEVRARQSELFVRINTELEALQDETHVSVYNRITTQVEPGSPPIEPMHGDRRRAELMTVALGTGMTLLGIGVLELRSKRRRMSGQGAESAENSDSEQQDPLRV